MTKLRLMFVGLALVTGVAHADDAADPFVRDMLILTDWFEGEFDNEEQRWFEADRRSATPEDDRIIRLHTIHRRVELPSFGKHVFYVEEFKNNNRDEVIRQRLVIFSSDLSVNAIRMKQGFFKEAKALLGAHEDTAKLNSLAPKDVTFLSECDVFWQRVADQFQGRMSPKSCVFGEGDERRYAVHDLHLSSSKYWRIDSTFLVSNDSLFVGYPLDRPVKMRKTKPFVCEVHLYNEPGESQVIKNLPLHSQGGMLQVKRDVDGASFDILMRDKEYPYYESRPDFIYFSIRRGGEERSIAYSVNDPDSRTLGMRTEEVGAFCHRRGFSFRESLEDLQ